MTATVVRDWLARSSANSDMLLWLFVGGSDDGLPGISVEASPGKLWKIADKNTNLYTTKKSSGIKTRLGIAESYYRLRRTLPSFMAQCLTAYRRSHVFLASDGIAPIPAYATDLSRLSQ